MKHYARNIIVQFTGITFCMVLLVSVALAFFLSRRLTERTIIQHIDIYPRLVESLVETQPRVRAFIEAGVPDPGSSSAALLVQNLLNYGTVFRVKVWRLDGTVLWSDKTEIIGVRFPANEELEEAAQGKIHYEIANPAKDENIYEKTGSTMLEIYVPINHRGRTIGIIELYEDADRLFWDIGKNNRFVWQLVGGAGLVIYALLFLIYYNAHKRQQLTSERLNRTQQAIISSLAYQAEIRDVETGRHLDRTTAYVKVIAEELRGNSPYQNYLGDEYIDDLLKASPLHDIGKVGVPDAILCKPGKLTAEEYEIMKKHCENGAAVLEMAIEKLAFRSFLSIAVQVVLHHHERWDGTGYPHGLAGEKIPLSARIMALADVYDALRSARCYKKAFPHSRSREIILAEKGAQFDPQVVDAFQRREAEFEKISTELADEIPDHLQECELPRG